MRLTHDVTGEIGQEESRRVGTQETDLWLSMFFPSHNRISQKLSTESLFTNQCPSGLHAPPSLAQGSKMRGGPGFRLRSRCSGHLNSPEPRQALRKAQDGKGLLAVPFFLEQVEAKSLSSSFTEGLLHFILQKKERRAPEHSRDGPGVISVLTGSPAANQHRTG